MDPLEALGRSASEFERRLRAVTADEWDLATPCADWTVRDLANHAVAGNTMAARLVDGCSREEAMEVVRGDLLGPDPLASYAESAEAQASAFALPDAMERTCHHPMLDMPGGQFIGFRIGDLTLHAWDLARAIGGDEALDPDLVRTVWEFLQPIAPVIGEIGVFGSGPSGGLADDAPLQSRLLDLTGRRP